MDGTTPGQVGYRNTNTNGIAKGDQPESMYMVADGTYYNGACCFDFGNSEMQAVAGGYGTMETIYFGNNDWWDKGVGSGPWIMADLEVGVYNMGGSANWSDANKNGNKINSASVSFAYPFVTAMLKGNSATATSGGPFVLKGANAQSGSLTTVWDGAFPVGYSPMNRQGGVVLGVGGDNSSGARGNFYEGVMTTGFASMATDDAIQANIVAAGYGVKTNTTLGATFFQYANYSGLNTKLTPGTYTFAQLDAAGIPDNAINSMQLDAGFDGRTLRRGQFPVPAGNVHLEPARLLGAGHRQQGHLAPDLDGNHRSCAIGTRAVRGALGGWCARLHGRARRAGEARRCSGGASGLSPSMPGVLASVASPRASIWSTLLVPRGAGARRSRSLSDAVGGAGTG